MLTLNLCFPLNAFEGKHRKGKKEKKTANHKNSGAKNVLKCLPVEGGQRVGLFDLRASGSQRAARSLLSGRKLRDDYVAQAPWRTPETEVKPNLFSVVCYGPLHKSFRRVCFVGALGSDGPLPEAGSEHDAVTPTRFCSPSRSLHIHSFSTCETATVVGKTSFIFPGT